MAQHRAKGQQMVCDIHTTTEQIGGNGVLERRAILQGVSALAGGFGMGVGLGTRSALAATSFDATAEARKIAFDRTGKGENVLLISGFPQTRRSWNRVVPLLAKDFQTIAADLPSFGDSGILSAPATTENVGRIFHEFRREFFAAPARRCTRLRRLGRF
jgi:pimeloyl-ACP methyl ester carboxylesterase